MVFTDLTLDEMMEVIGDHNVERKKLNARWRTWSDYLAKEFPKLFDLTNGKINPRVKYELCTILFYAEGNSFHRAYNCASFQPMSWVFTSGKRGYVTQIIDFGCGFDAQEFMIATVKKRRIHGVHFQTAGKGLNTFNLARHHKVNIDSTIGVGTSVNVLHEY